LSNNFSRVLEKMNYNLKQMDLKGKKVLITGGGSGLGQDAERQFTNLGAQVIICGRSPIKLQHVKDVFPATQIIRCDVTDEKELKDLKEQIETFGDIDILYNNAGAKYNSETTGYGKIDIFNSAALEVETNYLAIIRLNEMFIPILEKSQEPVIINTSSALAYLPAGRMPTYSASKAALHSYTIALRLQLQREQSKIKVYELMPPWWIRLSIQLPM